MIFKWEFLCGDCYMNPYVIKFLLYIYYIYISITSFYKVQVLKVHIKTGNVLITSVLKLTALFPH